MASNARTSPVPGCCTAVSATCSASADAAEAKAASAHLREASRTRGHLRPRDLNVIFVVRALTARVPSAFWIATATRTLIVRRPALDLAGGSTLRTARREIFARTTVRSPDGAENRARAIVILRPRLAAFALVFGLEPGTRAVIVRVPMHVAPFCVRHSTGTPTDWAP